MFNLEFLKPGSLGRDFWGKKGKTEFKWGDIAGYVYMKVEGNVKDGKV